MMDRRTALRAMSGVAVGSVLGGRLAAKEQPKPAGGFGFDTAKIVTAPLAEHLHVLSGPGGNIAIAIGPDGVLIVDSGVSSRSEGIKAAIAELSPKPIRTLVNTHWHFDHTGGNEYFARNGAVIIAHDNTRARMSATIDLDMMKIKVPPAPELARPVFTFSDACTLHEAAVAVHVRHVPPAHTDTDVIVRFPSANVVHMGDLYFNGMYPVIDYSTGGTLLGLLAASEAALGHVESDTKIIPGHGAVSGKEGLVAYRDLLRRLRDIFKPLVDAGKTLEEAIAAKPTAALDETYGAGPLRGDFIVSMMYKSLTGGKDHPSK
jgi:cyclase